MKQNKKVRNKIETCAIEAIHQDIVQTVQDKMPDQVALYELADLFKLFSDSTRASILWALNES